MFSNADIFKYAFDAIRFASERLAFQPDPHQQRVLHLGITRGLLNCTRQWGKSTTTALKVVHHACFNPDSLTVVLSPSERQSSEFVRKVEQFLRKLGIAPRGDGGNRISVLLPSGARIVGLPGKETTNRGYSGVTLLIIDEAARVDDELYQAVRPMIATREDAAIWLMSTPNGKRGFFHDEYVNRANWTYIEVPATECKRISKKFLDEERAKLPPPFFEQEYLCQFSATRSALFHPDDVDAAIVPDLPPLVPIERPVRLQTPSPLTLLGGMNVRYDTPWQHFYIGLDLGQRRDYSAVAVIEVLVTPTDQINKVDFSRILEVRYRLRHLDRIPLQTPYPETVDYVIDLLAVAGIEYRANLIVDATGVGNAFLDILKKSRPKAKVQAITITGGQSQNGTEYNLNVPKRDLVQSLQVMLRQGRLEIAKETPHTKSLTKELANMERHISDSGHVSFAPSKSTEHDDLVMATTLASWGALKHRLPADITPSFRLLPLLPETLKARW
ncbi:MAG: terminase family protein [Bryobacteraceae bacterium]